MENKQQDLEIQSQSSVNSYINTNNNFLTSNAKLEIQLDDVNDDWLMPSQDFDKIKLTDQEKSIFQFLLDVLEECKKKTILRVAGGWVRDKLIGKESNDIDIALDDMYGEEFAEIIRQKQYKNDVESGKTDQSKSKGYGVIKCNNDKSKHLETAVIKVQNQYIDLVNLRSEEYGEDSRVPEIKIGTPEQDAFRRDLTINSMFYNINLGAIEDFTGKGLIDLREKKANTPLQPLKTFIDDPLRVLRTIRFAQRFDLKISDEIYKAALDPKVRQAFEHKITFERIMLEMDKIFANKSPHISLQQMHDFGITSLCIKPPKECEEFNDHDVLQNQFLRKSVEICNILGLFLNTLKKQREQTKHTVQYLLGREFENCSTKDEKFQFFQKQLMYSGLLQPFRGYEYTLKKKQVTAVQHILQESLKQSNEIQKIVVQNHSFINEIQSIYMKFRQLETPLEEKDIIELATLLRTIGPNYNAVMLLHISQLYLEQEKNEQNDQTPSHHHIDLNILKSIMIEYEKLNNLIEKSGLKEIHLMKTAIDGKAIQDLYQCKPGKHMKFIIDECIKYQITHIGASIQQVEQYLLSNKEQFMNKYA